MYAYLSSKSILKLSNLNAIDNSSVVSGTSVGLSGYPVEVAAKTGTAEIGNTGRVHSWSIGFLPYKEPKIAWAIIMENGPVHNTIGATFVASQMIQWMVENNFLESL